MSEVHDFFVASVGAAAAFIGLLFVAVTLAPERILISLAALMPHAGLEIMLFVSVLSIALLGVIFGLYAYALATSWNLLGAKDLPAN